jgi:homocysteine S-methyltransferase
VKPFLDALARGPLLFDGAMGSLLYERGVFLTHCYDELNVSRPELIRQVHREYLDAGAEILESNTIGANQLALAKHGHSSKAADINRKGVELARSVARDHAYVAGAIGPSGIRWSVATDAERALAIRALTEQIQVLADAGADLLCIETFTSIVELETTIALAREHAPGLPVVAHLVFDGDCRAEGGLSPADVAKRLVAAGADVIGANCGIGFLLGFSGTELLLLFCY